jgi:hypothetical protein
MKILSGEDDTDIINMDVDWYKTYNILGYLRIISEYVQSIQGSDFMLDKQFELILEQYDEQTQSTSGA